MASESAVASVVQRLTSEPEFFLVPVTPSSSAVKQVCDLKKFLVLAIASLEVFGKICHHGFTLYYMKITNNTNILLFFSGCKCVERQDSIHSER